MFGEFGPTDYDLRFSVLGIPVRVHPVFWLSAAIIVWGWARGELDLVLVGMLCVFVSVLVHELGHAVVTRFFGWSPEIFLVFFGGYATTKHHSTWKNIAVLIAGPAAGFLLFFAVWGFLVAQRMYRFETHELVREAAAFLLWANLIWNGVNLLPVFPLDGGQICRELCLRFSPRRGLDVSLIISILAAGGMALWAVFHIMPERRGFFGLDPVFVAIMFGLLAFLSLQQYQMRRQGSW